MRIALFFLYLATVQVFGPSISDLPQLALERAVPFHRESIAALHKTSKIFREAVNNSPVTRQVRSLFERIRSEYGESKFLFFMGESERCNLDAVNDFQEALPLIYHRHIQRALMYAVLGSCPEMIEKFVSDEADVFYKTPEGDLDLLSVAVIFNSSAATVNLLKSYGLEASVSFTGTILESVLNNPDLFEFIWCPFPILNDESVFVSEFSDYLCLRRQLNRLGDAAVEQVYNFISILDVDSFYTKDIEIHHLIWQTLTRRPDILEIALECQQHDPCCTTVFSKFMMNTLYDISIANHEHIIYWAHRIGDRCQPLIYAIDRSEPALIREFIEKRQFTLPFTRTAASEIGYFRFGKRTSDELYHYLDARFPGRLDYGRILIGACSKNKISLAKTIILSNSSFIPRYYLKECFEEAISGHNFDIVEYFAGYFDINDDHFRILINGVSSHLSEYSTFSSFVACMMFVEIIPQLEISTLTAIKVIGNITKTFDILFRHALRSKMACLPLIPYSSVDYMKKVLLSRIFDLTVELSNDSIRIHLIQAYNIKLSISKFDSFIRNGYFFLIEHIFCKEGYTANEFEISFLISRIARSELGLYSPSRKDKVIGCIRKSAEMIKT